MSRRREQRRLAGIEDRRRREARRLQEPVLEAADELSHPCPNCEPELYEEQSEDLRRGELRLVSSTIPIPGVKPCAACGEIAFYAPI